MAEIIQMLKTGQDDLAWFDSNLNTLVNKYNNKFIAFHNHEIIDFDNEVDKLMKKLKNNNIDTSNVFIKFVSKIKAIL